MSQDLTIITNEEENTLRERLSALLPHTRQFDVLVRYFYISGFHRIYRVLVGEKVILDERNRSEDTPGRAMTARS